MKKIWILTIVALAAVLGSARAQSNPYGIELQGSLNYWVPDFELYDYAYGVDLECRNWFLDPVGLALGVGISSWEVKEGRSAVDPSKLKELDGQLTTIPLGPSLLYKIVDLTDWNLTAEGGVRYVFAQSSIHYKRADTGESGTLDIDESILGVLGLDYERSFDEGKIFFAGAGYQIDIDEGAIQLSDIKNTPNRLEAFFLRIGTKIQF